MKTIDFFKNRMQICYGASRKNLFRTIEEALEAVEAFIDDLQGNCPDVLELFGLFGLVCRDNGKIVKNISTENEYSIQLQYMLYADDDTMQMADLELEYLLGEQAQYKLFSANSLSDIDEYLDYFIEADDNAVAIRVMAPNPDGQLYRAYKRYIRGITPITTSINGLSCIL